MSLPMNLLKERFPGVAFAEGAQVDEDCRIDQGCEISAEAVLNPGVIICRNVKIIGKVYLDWFVIIRENATLIGPLNITTRTIIGHDAIIGASQPDFDPEEAETKILEHCLIGHHAEIDRGIKLGRYAKVRSESKVIGDAPDYALVSHAPAIVERFACPECGGFLTRNRVMGLILVMECPACGIGDLRFAKTAWSGIPAHVLLPEGRLGDHVKIDGDDFSWDTDVEMQLTHQVR